MTDIPHLGASLMKVAVPLFAIVAVIAAHRIRGLPLREHLALTKPPIGKAALCVIVFTGYMLGTNYLSNWRGGWDFAQWREGPLMIDILRVLGVAILGPIAEELIFRGVIYYRLALTKLGMAGAILVTAVAWGCFHLDYRPTVLARVVLGGCLLGAARYWTASVITPIIMHIVWNVYAIS
jgi:membrane protease YdiL (CAAX protease family)